MPRSKPGQTKRKNDTEGLSDDARATFLSVLADTANVTRACREIKLSRVMMYWHKHNDPVFNEQWDQAVALGAHALEDEAVRRGAEGFEKPVYQGGVLVGTVREYSDTLLMGQLKARLPERYKERTSTEMSGVLGHALAQVTPEQLENVVRRVRNEF